MQRRGGGRRDAGGQPDDSYSSLPKTFLKPFIVNVFRMPGSREEEPQKVSRLAFLIASFLSLSAMQASARDISLAEAESLLLRNNRELQAARRAVESAEAQQMIAGARPNATFAINSGLIGSGGKPDTVFRIDQPFERGNKRDLRLDAAAGLQRAARNDSLDVLRQQLALLRGTYFDLKLAQERAEVLAQTAQLFSVTLNAAQRRLKAGDLAPADVAKVQVDHERAQNDARGAQAEFARAQIALAYLIGAEREAPELRAVDPWPAPQRADAATLERAIEERPDVAAARQRVEAAERLRDLARALPTRARGSPSSPSGAAPSRCSRCSMHAARCARCASRRSVRGTTTPGRLPPGPPRRPTCRHWKRDEASHPAADGRRARGLRREGEGAAAAIHRRAAQHRHLPARQPADRHHHLGADRAAARHDAALQRPPGVERGPHRARLRAVRRARHFDRGAPG